MKRSSWNDWRISITSSLLLGLTSLPGVEEVSEREAFPLVTPWQSFSSITKTCSSRPDSLIRTLCVWVFSVRVMWVYSVRLRWLKWDSNTVFSNKSTLYAENTGDWLLKQLTPFEACSWVTVYLKCSLLRIVFIVAPYLNRLILRPVTTGKFLFFGSANNSSLKNKCIIVAISSTLRSDLLVLSCSFLTPDTGPWRSFEATRNFLTKNTRPAHAEDGSYPLVIRIASGGPEALNWTTTTRALYLLQPQSMYVVRGYQQPNKGNGKILGAETHVIYCNLQYFYLIFVW